MIEIKIDKGQYLLNAAAGFQWQVFGASQSRAARQREHSNLINTQENRTELKN